MNDEHLSLLTLYEYKANEVNTNSIWEINMSE